MSLGLPGRGVSTLDALAAGIAAAGATGERLAVLDGYRGEVFVALYDAGGATLWEPAVMRPEALAERLARVTDAPVGRRFGGGTISSRVGRCRRDPHPGRRRSRPSRRRAPRLRPGGGGGGLRIARTDLPQTSRRGALA